MPNDGPPAFEDVGYTPLAVEEHSQPLVLNQVLTEAQKRIARYQFLSLCLSLFLIGWNDGSIGPLLHRIQEHYNVNYASASYIFVMACTGAVVGGVINMPLDQRFGLGRMLVIGSLLQVVVFAAQAMALPFPLFVITFAVGGIGIAIQDAQGNGFIATVKHDGELKMGFLQAAYGLGALASPLSATQFAQMTHWSFHYLVSLALSILNTVVLARVFRFRTQDECLVEAGETLPEESSEEVGYKQILQLKAVHLLAIFLILYIGVEVTIGGWVVTFIRVIRGGGPSSGYVASGFFGGLTAGRVLLIWVNQKIGEVNAIWVYTVLALLFQLTVWLVPSIVLNTIAICFIGVLLGPMYPIVMRHSARIIPRHLVTGSIGWIAAAGAVGSALLPFFTGRLANTYGIQSLQPFLAVMMVIMGGIWGLVPKKSLPGQE
ncbi:MFS general substrate transporter [Gymnopilus junonius]|uniref:MFS general substrate transporter n=1 Tax=Gymnopilus junonius TaxID=109634 RepID=A0A9P5NXC7_GYMJU|nr:MFS general substrate transporter [Gymnopilus junonius]